MSMRHSGHFARSKARVSRWQNLLRLMPVALMALPLASAHGQSVAEFYKGRQVSLIVSSSPGGGYDATARLVARHLPKHLAGAPNVVVKNMPGAGGILAPNFVHAKGERDGSLLALMQNTIPFEPLFGNKRATFDALKLNWLGSPNYETGVLMVWHEAKPRSIDDLRQQEITIAVPAHASTPAFNTRMLIHLLGLKLKIVPGYGSATASVMAMEKGEVDSFANFYNSVIQARPTWIKEKKTFLLLQWGPHKEKSIASVPYLPELLKDPAQLALARAGSASLALGRPFMMPPGVPADRVQAMRQAMFATFNDPEFVKDAHKIGFTDLAPQTGEQIERIIREVYASPPEVIKGLQMFASGDGMK